MSSQNTRRQNTRGQETTAQKTTESKYYRDLIPIRQKTSIVNYRKQSEAERCAISDQRLVSTEKELDGCEAPQKTVDRVLQPILSLNHN